MFEIYHHPFSVASRFARLIVGEYGLQANWTVERVWERRHAFMLMNPAGTLPVASENGGPPIVGATPFMEYVDETRGYAQGDRRLMPDHPDARAETRRLVEWFLVKFDGEVSSYLAHEKLMKLEMPRELGGGAPDSAVLRAARANVQHHLAYVSWLAASRNWLAGPRISFADLAAGAAISVVDYLGEVNWDTDEALKSWYARLKSRPSFRTLLADRVLALPPPASYADLDF
jgi:glutathione S-transferase